MANESVLNLTATQTRQPKSFYLIFFVELWERFGYYGVQAILVLYVTKTLGFSDSQSYETFAAFNALMYIAPLAGGYLADNFIGYKRGIWIGMLLLMSGYTLLALGDRQSFYTALGLIIVGCGFFKTCPASLLGKVYDPNDPRLEGGYTLFYMSINIGSIVSMSAIGYVAELLGWHFAFGMCAAGLLIGLVTFICFRNILSNVGSPTDLLPLNKKYIAPLIIGAGVGLFIFTQLLNHLSLTHYALALVGIALVVFYVMMLFRLPLQERNKLLACLILTLFAISFYTLYFQAPMTLTLFTDRNVVHSIFGVFVPTASFQSLNPFWIIVLAPLLAASYNFLANRQANPTIPMKFAIGIIIMGMGFLVLTLSAGFANANGMVSSGWVISSYFFQSFAELLVSAIGLAMIAKLAPTKLLGMMMGTWFLSTAAAAAIAGQIAKLASIPKDQLNPLTTLHIYSHAFLMYGLASIFVGVVALVAVPFLNRLIVEPK